MIMKYSIRLKTNVPESLCDCLLYHDKAVFKVKHDKYDDAYFAVNFEFEDWSKNDYMLMPSCAYNGNRFKSVPRKYPPMFLEEERGLMPPITITDVPRLEVEDDSKMEVTTGDMATPAVGLYFKKDKKGCLIYTTQGIGPNNFGITFEETGHKSTITISYPVKRQKHYIGNSLREASDKELTVYAGDVIEIPFKIVAFEGDSINDLFKTFFETRKCMTSDCEKGAIIAFSKAWEIQEEKFNSLNYREKGGYYGVGTEGSRFQDWQVGWVGGGMSSYALLFEGKPHSRERACNTLDFMFEMQSKAGFFYGIVNNGVIYGDGFNYPGTENFHLIRKSADALYFIFKQFDLLLKRKAVLKQSWIEGARKCSDAFVKTWEKYGQWGQFIDVETGDIKVGNSSAAAITPAGLALAYNFFNEDKYLSIAETAAEYYYRRDVCSGVMTGGPGEILQCPDSESSFGMLESFMTLYEITGSEKWVKYAEDTANQCSSWCVSYNYVFPENSEFGRLNVKSLGSVFANVQNKHSAPGICTLSGNSLLKLFRASGNIKYLEFMSDIGSFIVQCMSREDRPIYSWDKTPQKLLPGFICERVNMSDWEGAGKIGGVFNGSCWSEVSQMLTYAELPGVYAVKDKKILHAIDHVNAYFNEHGDIVVENIFEYDVVVKVMIENSGDLGEPLGVTYENKLERVSLKPFECKVINL